MIVVFIHTGYKSYVDEAVQITARTNKNIFFIGDESCQQIKNVTFVDISRYQDVDMNLRGHFVNYSTNNADYEWFCFKRIFILRAFMKDHGFDSVFHLDSDAVLLRNIDTFPFEKPVAYCVSPNYSEFWMSASIHAGLLTVDFCDDFEQLFRDLYENKSRFHLIEPKIRHHRENGVPGGICDMTLYHLLSSNVQNLMCHGFVNNINTGEGPVSNQQYEKHGPYLKLLRSPEGFHLSDGTLIWSLHFQGGAKHLIHTF
jgi:hypothetical protein